MQRTMESGLLEHGTVLGQLKMIAYLNFHKSLRENKVWIDTNLLIIVYVLVFFQDTIFKRIDKAHKTL